eukprot:SAG31_NODE_25969_length_451_cov_0.428977_1_plen_100_part_10
MRTFPDRNGSVFESGNFLVIVFCCAWRPEAEFYTDKAEGHAKSGERAGSSTPAPGQPYAESSVGFEHCDFATGGVRHKTCPIVPVLSVHCLSFVLPLPLK